VKEFLYDTDEKGPGARVQGLDKKGITDRSEAKKVIIFLSIKEILDQAFMSGFISSLPNFPAYGIFVPGFPIDASL